MKKIVLFIVVFKVLGCSESKEHLKMDMDRYCSCMSAYETTDELNLCLKQLDSLTQHYEFDPESIDYISSRIKECPVSR